jgi:hypothetical protein
MARRTCLSRCDSIFRISSRNPLLPASRSPPAHQRLGGISGFTHLAASSQPDEDRRFPNRHSALSSASVQPQWRSRPAVSMVNDKNEVEGRIGRPAAVELSALSPLARHRG